MGVFTRYAKVVFLDADVLVLKNIDDLFAYPELSGARARRGGGRRSGGDRGRDAGRSRRRRRDGQRRYGSRCFRRGLARALVQICMDAARRRNIRVITLNASDAGLTLYEGLGFHTSNEMLYSDTPNIPRDEKP